jgi:hypothetical protein
MTPPVVVPMGPARAAVVAVGTLLIGLAAAAWPRRVAPVAEPPRQPLGGRVMLAAGVVATRVPLLRRGSDDQTLSTRLAVAPRCWVARWTAAALSAWHVRAAVSAVDPGTPPALAAVAAGARLIGGVASAAAAGGLGLLAGPPAAGMLALVGFLAGMVLPDAALHASARRSRRAGTAAVAGAVDLLAAAASAGLSLPEAMVLTANHAPPALAAVLRATAVRRAMGDDPRVALEEEGRRFGVPALADVAQAVERQRRLGVALGPELAEIAVRLRTERRAHALRRAARRAPFGTLIVALVIVPACLTAVIACVVGGLLQGGALALR